MHKRRLHTLGVTPATDTSTPPPSKLNVKATAIGITIVVLAVGGLWWLNEQDDEDDD